MRHLYIHVPFCARRCTYCDFAIAVRKRVPAERYVQAVLAEYAWRRAQLDWDDEPLETLYLGGGTPSLLPPEHLARLVRTILDAESVQTLPPSPEVTLEANPEDVTAASAHDWREAGITRVSLGVQSFDPEVLAWMHRTHGPGSTAQAVQALRAAGDIAICLDLIFARPDERPGDFRRDLHEAIALEPDHMSVYGLTVEHATALARWVARGAMTPAREERYADEFLLAHRLLEGAGFEHYEVSNYARPGHRARHNEAYWTGNPYAGLGPSAHSYRDGRRWWNVRDWAAYERLMAEAGDPTAGEETLDAHQQRLERVYLGLRTARGVPLDDVGSAAVALVAANGWGVSERGRLRATPEGWLRLDALVATLTTSGEGG